MSDDEKKSGSGSEGEEECYEVEKIISHKKSKGTILYEVKWKGYSLEETTWEPEDNLDGSQEILDEYKNRMVDSGKKKEKASRTSATKKARGSSTAHDDTPVKDEPEPEPSDDDDFVEKKPKREPKAKRSRKSVAAVESDSEDEDKPAPKVDYKDCVSPRGGKRAMFGGTLPAASDCEEVISVGRPKKTPADIPSDTLYFLVKFTKSRKLLVPSDDCLKYYPSQLASFLLKRVQFREGGAMANGNGHGSPLPADDLDDRMDD